jgi:hypothetical protein
MSKHTEGPWKCFKEHGQFFVEAVDVALIASINARHERGSPIYDGQETEANARLIAAAPDLLEALKVCLNGITTPGTFVDTNSIMTLILRAEGRDA